MDEEKRAEDTQREDDRLIEENRLLVERLHRLYERIHLTVLDSSASRRRLRIVKKSPDPPEKRR